MIKNNFENFISDLQQKDKSGKNFEEFVKWFLKRDPTWSNFIKKIWLWDEYPKRWGIDKGIDLIFEDINKKIWAVQAKSYNHQYSISKADIDSFLSESSRSIIFKRLLISTSNRIGSNALDVINGQEKPILKFLLEDFKKSPLKFPYDSEKIFISQKLKKPIPYSYQIDAIKDVTNKFKTEDIGQLIMACGTGKTFVTMWIKEKIKSKLTLVLVPSLILLSKTVKEWAFASNEDIKTLSVCSDKSVTKQAYDEIRFSSSDLSFPVTNNLKEIKNFINSKGNKVIYCTYQSIDLIELAQKSKNVNEFEFIIADEAHKCTGQIYKDNYFTKVLDRKRIRARKVLFTTATPRIYGEPSKKKLQEADIKVYGMDDPNKFGNIFHTLSFYKAINNKPPLLSDYEVVITGVTNNEIIKKIKDRELVKIDKFYHTDLESLGVYFSILKNIKKFDLKKLITFHNRIDKAKDFSLDINRLSNSLRLKSKYKKKVSAEYINGSMSSYDRSLKLNTLDHNTKKQTNILSNARCLTEGVDVPTLDAIAFIDSRKSKIDIIQSIGRAIRLDKNKIKGYIIIPIFININDNINLELEKSSYKKIWWVINALKSHDQSLIDELEDVRIKLGSKKISARSKKITSRITLDLPTEVNDKFFTSLKSIIVSNTSASWYFNYGQLKKYYNQYKYSEKKGSRFISPDGINIGSWVSKQRSNFKYDEITRRKYRLKPLSPKQIKLLESLKDWVWDPFQNQWDDAFERLKKFIFENSYYPKSAKYAKGAEELFCSNWLLHQRKAYKENKLEIDKIKKLDSLPNFTWDWIENRWMNNYYLLIEYVDNFKRIPPVRIEYKGIKIGRWVNHQIQFKKEGNLTKKRTKLLNEIKFWRWDVLNFKSTKFEDNFLKLLNFLNNNNISMINFGTKDKNNFPIGEFIFFLKDKKKEKKGFSKTILKQIESISGWKWEK